MRKLTNLLVAGTLSMAMITPVLAEDAQPLIQNNLEDAGLIFETDVQPMQLAVLSEKEMRETEGAFIPVIVGGLHALNYARYAIGPVSAWVRVGNSFSRSGDFGTRAVRWGSNSHYRNSIGSESLRNFNSRLHDSRIPVNSWRTNDTGHLHLWRR